MHSLISLPLLCPSSSSSSIHSCVPCARNLVIVTDNCLSNADAIDATNRSANSVFRDSPTMSTMIAATNFLHHLLYFLLAYIALLLFDYYGGFQLHYLSTVRTLISFSSLLFECFRSSRERSVCHNAVQTDEPAAKEEEEEGEVEEEEGEMVERLAEAPGTGFGESQRSPNFDAPRSCPVWLMRSWSTEDEGVNTSCEVANIPSYYECEEAVRAAAAEGSGGGEEAKAEDANDAAECWGGRRRWWGANRHLKEKKKKKKKVEDKALDEDMEEEGLMHRVDRGGPLHGKSKTQQRRGGRWRRVLTTLVATMCGRSRQTQHHRRRQHRHRFTDSGLTLL